MIKLLSRNPTALRFFFNDPATTEIYTLSLHDALPISRVRKLVVVLLRQRDESGVASHGLPRPPGERRALRTDVEKAIQEAIVTIFAHGRPTRSGPPEIGRAHV